jgi:Na+/melibiose symporter-like transporter
MTDQARSSTAVTVSPLRLFAYALPAVPIAALGQPFYMFAPTFYAKEVGIGAGMIGLILLIVRVLDAASDLAAGRLSDQTGGRFGRRRPWVLLASPLAAWSAYMIMTPPDGAGAAYFALWTLLVSISWAAITLPLNAWGAELSPDYRERIVVTAWRDGSCGHCLKRRPASGSFGNAGAVCCDHNAFGVRHLCAFGARPPFDHTAGGQFEGGFEGLCRQ